MVLDFFLAICLTLIVAWVLGEALHRLGQPPIVGQLLAGLIIGPSLLGLVQPTSALVAVENVGVFLIMLLTGLVVRPGRILAAGKRGLVVSSVAFVVPFTAGFAVARFFGISVASSLTVALTISITAVPVNSIILMELGLLESDLGATVIAAGVIDDVVSFIALGIIQQLASDGNRLSAGDSYGVLSDAIRILVFFAGVFVCERLLRMNLGRVTSTMEGIVRRTRVPGSRTAVLSVLAVGISSMAELAGLQFVIGAFFAGLLLSELVGDRGSEETVSEISGVTLGFLGPIAFALIGSQLVLSSVTGVPLLIGVLIAAALAAKFLGGYVGARIARFSGRERVLIGFLVNSRGFLELVIASTAYQTGLIDQTVFSVLVVVGIVTTVISPIASRAAARGVAGRERLRDSLTTAKEPT